MTAPEISRRTLLELLAGAGVLVTVSGCSGDTTTDDQGDAPAVSAASDGTPVATADDDASPANALANLRDYCALMKVLGSYPDASPPREG